MATSEHPEHQPGVGDPHRCAPGQRLIGVRYYLTERFVLRADYSIYTAFLNDTRSGEYRALTGGLSFFF